LVAFVTRQGSSTAIAFAESAHAARPFVTDDARVVDPDHCQLETFYKEQRAYSGHEFWFLPACNKLDVEWTVAGNRIEGENNLIVQGKKLFKPLEPDGYGLALSVGSFGGDPYANGIASFSFFKDWSVIHTNLGYLKDRATWGVGLEQLVLAPRIYAILETFGERGDMPTQHAGIRFWVFPTASDRFHVRHAAVRPGAAFLYRRAKVSFRSVRSSFSRSSLVWVLHAMTFCSCHPGWQATRGGCRSDPK
jgi:hypothetical protein